MFTIPGPCDLLDTFKFMQKYKISNLATFGKPELVNQLKHMKIY